jgi:hypothetical protein
MVEVGMRGLMCEMKADTEGREGKGGLMPLLKALLLLCS